MSPSRQRLTRRVTLIAFSIGLVFAKIKRTTASTGNDVILGVYTICL